MGLSLKRKTEEVAEGPMKKTTEVAEEKGPMNKSIEVAAEIGPMPKKPTYGGALPEYIVFRERMFNELKFINRWKWSDEDLLLSCDEYALRRITREEAIKHLPILRQYLKARDEGGFDIDVRPSIGLAPYGIYPISVSEKKLQKFKHLAELALESYNKDNDKTDYKFIKVVKANSNCGGRLDWYFLTFTAKDVSARGRYRSPKTFQAEVGVPMFDSETAEVPLCRIKPRK